MPYILSFSGVQAAGTPAGAAPPRIDRLPEGEPRPRFSVMIPVYNGADYLRDTLRSVLDQDFDSGEVEITVVDNCSTADDPEAVVREVGGGRVSFYRQATNVGVIENHNTCVRLARGEWVHILHADDLVRPGFFARARRAIVENPAASAFTCRLVYIDETGLWTGLSELEARSPGLLGDDFVRRQLLEQRIQFAGMVVRRRVYEDLGGFRPELTYCSDWDMWNRVVTHNQLFYDPELLACFRVHSGSEGHRMIRSGENVAAERRAIRIACAYVAPEEAWDLQRRAMRMAAIRASRRVRRLWRSGDHAAALRQLREALRCSVAPTVLTRLLAALGSMLVEPPNLPLPPKAPGPAVATSRGPRPRPLSR